MRTIKIVIEKDDCSWRATSPDINGMFIFANSLNEVRELVKWSSFLPRFSRRGDYRSTRASGLARL